MSVVVGYLRTKEGAAAVDRAVEEAVLRGLPLVVVHVDEPDRPGSTLAELRGRLDGSGVEYRLQTGYRGLDVADEIVQTAEAEQAQLIVIGLRHRSAVGKFLLGSNAQRILLDARCPVLAVKAADR
jgi:nucleotide-binding universal stress UspA family protein